PAPPRALPTPPRPPSGPRPGGADSGRAYRADDGGRGQWRSCQQCAPPAPGCPSTTGNRSAVAGADPARLRSHGAMRSLARCSHTGIVQHEIPTHLDVLEDEGVVDVPDRGGLAAARLG